MCSRCVSEDPGSAKSNSMLVRVFFVILHIWRMCPEVLAVICTFSRVLSIGAWFSLWMESSPFGKKFWRGHLTWAVLSAPDAVTTRAAAKSAKNLRRYAGCRKPTSAHVTACGACGRGAGNCHPPRLHPYRILLSRRSLSSPPLLFCCYC